MNSSVSVCCLCVLLVLHVGGAKPLNSDLQSLKQLLEEELHTAPFYSEDADDKDDDADKAAFGAPEQSPWEPVEPGNSAADKDNLLARLVKDLVRTSKRSWSRYKKGGLRSCFGVRLERIGSFSGLGC